MAIDLADGGTVWERQLSDGGGAAMIDDSPLVTVDRVYLGDARGRLHALDRTTGAVVWSRRLDAHPLTRIFSSPVLVDGLLVVGVASVELALPTSDFAFRGSVVGLDAVTGAERWRLPTSAGTDGAGVSVWSSAAIDRERELAYIGTGQAYEEPAGPRSDSLLAIRYETGELAWSRQFTADDVFTFFSPPPRGPTPTSARRRTCSGPAGATSSASATRPASTPRSTAPPGRPCGPAGSPTAARSGV